MKTEIRSRTMLAPDESVLTVLNGVGEIPFSSDQYEREAAQLFTFLTEVFAMKTLYHLSCLLNEVMGVTTAVAVLPGVDALVEIDPESGKPTAWFKRV